MDLTIEPGTEMAALESLGRELEQACRSLGLAPEMSGWVTAAGVSALSALVLAGAREPRLELDKGLAQVTLSLEYAPGPQGQGTAIPGLAAGLFSPPALRVEQDCQGERMVWTAVWEA